MPTNKTQRPAPEPLGSGIASEVEPRPWITSVELRAFRGIMKGSLEGLGQLTILTGTNGCGKSTVLDAILCGASPHVGDAIGQAVKRHPLTRSGGEWLRFLGPNGSRVPTIGVHTGAGTRWVRSLEAYAGPSDGQRRLEDLGSDPPYYRIVCREIRSAPDASLPEKVEGNSVGVAEFGADNQYLATETPELSSEQSLQRIRLVDPAVAKPLESTFSDVKRSPQGASLSGWLKEVGIEDLQLLMDVDGRTPALHVTRAGAVVPLGLAGDGLHSLVHTVLELAAARDGVVLLEEPESYQHPMSLYQTALGIVAGVRRGLQVVLSTHSVELIDALLSHLGDAEAWRAALFTLALRDGELRSSRLAGVELLEARLIRRHGVR